MYSTKLVKTDYTMDYILAMNYCEVGHLLT